jgi:hypothetical protein
MDASTSEHEAQRLAQGTLEWEEKLDEFLALMKKQILRNSHKGMRDAWLDYPLEGDVQAVKMSVEEARLAMAYGIDVDEKWADVAVWAFISSDAFHNNPALRGIPLHKRFTGE